MFIHVLANGARLMSLSPSHGFRFSDGTECGPQQREFCDLFTLRRDQTLVGDIKGMSLYKVSMVLSELAQARLKALCEQVDIVLVPFPMLTALREQNIREHYPNAVAFNATPETSRSAPGEKVVDINNWSY
jgi:hypothetical protein